MLDLLRDNLPPRVLLGLAALLAATLYGLAGYWAAAGRVGWLGRIAPIALLLAALVPLGAFELIALFGTQAAVIVAWVNVAQIVPAYRAARAGGRRRRDAVRTTLRQWWAGGPQFRLRDLLAAVLLAAGVLAIVRHVDPSASLAASATSVVFGLPYAGFVVMGFLAGVVTIAAEWIVFGRAKRFYRVAVLLLPCAALYAAWHLAAGESFLLVPSWMLGVVGWMALMRAAGWRFWRRDANSEHPTEQDAIVSGLRRPGRLVSRVAGCATAVVALAILLPLYIELLPGQAPTFDLPDPNGHEEVPRLVKSLNWSAVPTQDVEIAGGAACRQFVRDNAMTLADVRKALRLPSSVPIVCGPEFVASQLPHIQDFRVLARALAVEAKAARIEGQHGQAANICLDLLDLGRVTSTGGLLIDELVGIAIKGVGLGELVPLVGQLDATELAEIGRRLEQADDGREPIGEILARDKMVCRLSYGWPYRLLFVFDDPLVTPAIDASKMARARGDTHLRLLLTEAAVRRYQLEYGSPPESLEALVPEYLSKVPGDAFGDGPLRYRRTDDGYLLYSVGRNGVDDGGQRTTYAEAVIDGKGDFFFDASLDETTASAEEAESEEP